jgi:hypothetical protein
VFILDYGLNQKVENVSRALLSRKKLPLRYGRVDTPGQRSNDETAFAFENREILTTYKLANSERDFLNFSKRRMQRLPHQRERNPWLPCWSRSMQGDAQVLARVVGHLQR